MIDHGKDEPIPYPKPTEGECALHEAMMKAIREQVAKLNELDKRNHAMNDEIHSCSYYCDRPACIKAQRDELVRKYVEVPTSERVRVPFPMAESNAPDHLGPDEKQTYADGFNACRELVLSTTPEAAHDHP